MDNKTKNRIIGALRSISRSWGPRLAAKAKNKVGPATFRCESCGIWIYEGKSQKAVQEMLTQRNKPVIMDKAHVDHIDAVVPLEGWKDFKDFSTNVIDRIFCEVDNLRILCAPCHAAKTKVETAIRKQHRHKKKADQEGLLKQPKRNIK